MKPTRIFLFLILIFFGCKHKVEKFKDKKDTSSNVEISKFTIPENVDDDFNVFLNYFSKDSIFQISRIIFPLTVTEVDENNMLDSIERTIEKSEHAKLDFTYPKDALTREFDRYFQTSKINENEAVVEIRGVDNGIFTDVYFEKVNGKWFLKSWNENSN